MGIAALGAFGCIYSLSFAFRLGLSTAKAPLFFFPFLFFVLFYFFPIFFFLFSLFSLVYFFPFLLSFLFSPFFLSLFLFLMCSPQYPCG